MSILAKDVADGGATPVGIDSSTFSATPKTDPFIGKVVSGGCAGEEDDEEDVGTDDIDDDDFRSFSLSLSLHFFLCLDFSFFKLSNAGLITVGSPRIVGFG